MFEKNIRRKKKEKEENKGWEKRIKIKKRKEKN